MRFSSRKYLQTLGFGLLVLGTLSCTDRAMELSPGAAVPYGQPSSHPNPSPAPTAGPDESVTRDTEPPTNDDADVNALPASKDPVPAPAGESVSF